MNLSRMTEDVSNITVQPNQFIGKAADLKKLFDKSGEDIKAYINNTLIPELEKLKLSDITNDGNGSFPFATTEEVANAIANLVDSSPDALDTLKELANALGNDPEFSTTVLNLIGTKVDKTTYEEDIVAFEGMVKENKEDISGLKDNFDYLDNERNLMDNEITTLKSEKVDKVNGKGLSEEDYTTEEKQKLSDLPTNEELQRVLEKMATKEETTDEAVREILLIDQTTQEIYKLCVDNGVIKVFNTKDSILVMGNNATVNEEVLILSNDIATVLNETLLINEGTLK